MHHASAGAADGAGEHDGRGSGLRALAARVGIAAAYDDVEGRRHETGDATRERLLAAMGFAVADDAAARAELAALEARERARLLAPTRVAIDGERGEGAPGEVLARVDPAAAGGAIEWALALEHEDGTVARAGGRGRADGDGTLRLALPGAPPTGYHALRLVVRDGGGEHAATQRLIVVPPRCADPAARLAGQRVVGLTANLYTVRSARNWGVGDVADLRALLALARDAGAAFVGVNPLHALRNADGDISPYSPVSRLWRNPIYLDVETVPELVADEPHAAAARALLARDDFRRRVAALRDGTHVDYPGTMACKSAVLELLHRAFRAGGEGARRAYADWVRAAGAPLERFATFRALDERLRPEGAGWWREWPAELQDPRSAAVARFRAEHEERVDFHRWCQWALDRQLADAAADARALGLPVGLYQDLAIGASPAGSDVWSEPDLFLRGVSVGAPPDPLGPEGQNWGLPPIDPRRLQERGYDYWVALVRAAMAHAGALRIDHVLGLFRQFWIPEGMRGADGAYVRFPTDDLLGILALESARAGALVVGEDLGTVPPEVPPSLARWGVLSSKVLYFERDGDGSFRPPRRYPAMALATVNTHDLAPVAGWWRGRDVELRVAVGQVAADDAERVRGERARERWLLLRLLCDEGLLDPAVLAGEAPLPEEAAVRALLHTLLRRTPSWMVGLSLDDLAGEVEPVNLPGVGLDGFASWSRRMRLPLERLRTDPAVRLALGAERVWVAGLDAADAGESDEL